MSFGEWVKANPHKTHEYKKLERWLVYLDSQISVYHNQLQQARDGIVPPKPLSSIGLDSYALLDSFDIDAMFGLYSEAEKAERKRQRAEERHRTEVELAASSAEYMIAHYNKERVQHLARMAAFDADSIAISWQECETHGELWDALTSRLGSLTSGLSEERSDTLLDMLDYFTYEYADEDFSVTLARKQLLWKCTIGWSGKTFVSRDSTPDMALLRTWLEALDEFWGVLVPQPDKYQDND